MNSIELRYQAALDYIYGFVDYSRNRNQRYSAEAFDLARMRRLLAYLGNPHHAYPTVLIAGTKGKGSVAAMLASCFRSAGNRTGLYSSPHLVEFGERIQVDGVKIPAEDLVELVDQIKPAVEQVPEISHFEIITALGFLHFERLNVDVGVIEVGLGGRLDATNVLSPAVSVITQISYDHTGILGDTLTQIATEKAGIIKPSVPVVIAPQIDEVRGVLARIASERQAPLLDVESEWKARRLDADLSGQRIEAIRLDGTRAKTIEFKLPLLGPHQVTNALTALATLEICRESGLEIPDRAIQAGMTAVEWPGRFQVLARHPFVVADSAHNRVSAAMLSATCEEYFPGKRPVVVFGASTDKDVEGMLSELLPRSSLLIATQAFHPRALEPDRICDMARKYAVDCEIKTPVQEAVRHALRIAEHDDLVLVSGSLFVVGELLDAWPELRKMLRQAEGVD